MSDTLSAEERRDRLQEMVDDLLQADPTRHARVFAPLGKPHNCYVLLARGELAAAEVERLADWARGLDLELAFVVHSHRFYSRIQFHYQPRAAAVKATPELGRRTVKDYGTSPDSPLYETAARDYRNAAQRDYQRRKREDKNRGA